MHEYATAAGLVATKTCRRHEDPLKSGRPRSKLQVNEGLMVGRPLDAGG